MAVAYSAISASSSFADDTTFTSPNEAAIKGALVFIAEATAASAPDEIAEVTWGGDAMTRVGTAYDDVGEFLRVYAYFLGSSIPTGTQTVSIDCSGTVTTKQAYAIALTAGADTAVEGFAVISAPGDPNVANPSVTITTGAGVETWVAAILNSGLGVPGNITAGTGYTLIANRDFGNQVLQVERINANDAGGNVVANFTAAADDVAMIAVAIKEAAGGATTVVAPAGSASATRPTTVVQVAVAGVSVATAASAAPALLAVVGVPVASATGSAVAPGYSIVQPVPAAAATAAIAAPTLSQGASPTIVAPAAAATAQVVAAAFELRAVAVTPSATGGGTVGTPTLDVPIPATAATGQAAAPLPMLRAVAVAPSVIAGSGSCTPAITVTALVAAAAASRVAPIVGSAGSGVPVSGSPGGRGRTSATGTRGRNRVTGGSGRTAATPV